MNVFLEYLNREYLNVPLWRWMLFLCLWLLLYLVVSFAMKVIRKKLHKRGDSETTKRQDEKQESESHANLNRYRILAHVLDRTLKLTFVAISLIFAMLLVPLPPSFEETMRHIAVALLILQAGFWGMAYIDNGIEKSLMMLNVRETAAKTAMGVLRFFALILLWIGICVLILQNIGIEIGPLIAGLGIGGLAIAFALQKILEDIFCSVAIVLDRPFEVGDFIIMGEVLGTIERIGIKTTRIRSLSGEQIIVSNGDLTNSRIRNYKRMPQRRVVFSFGILYQTPADVVERVGGWVKEIIESIEKTKYDRAHLKEFGDSSYNYEVVYYVLEADYNLYMDIQQKINLAMIRKFKTEGVDFAYPTRTLYMETLPPVELKGGRNGWGGESIGEAASKPGGEHHAA